MATTLTPLLPPTRSGRTFFAACALLGTCALVQLLVLAGYLIGGGAAAHRRDPASATTAARNEPAPALVPSATVSPTILAPVLPTPAPAAPVEAPALALVRPTPAPAARLQNNPTDLLEQARQLRARGDMNSALARLREAEVAEPDSPQIIAEMARTYEAMQIPDRAFEQWQRLYNLGEAAGALYDLAEFKLHNVPAATPAAAQNPPAAGTAGPDTSAFPTQGDAVLKLTDIHMEPLEDAAAEQKVALKIVVKNRPGTAIDPTKVKILTYFYDLVDGKDIVQTNAQTEYAWLTPGRIDWANDKSEVLQTVYTRLKAAPAPAATPEAAAPKKGRRGKGAVAEATPAPTATPTPSVRTYLGYAVQLYYDRQLQDVQADPVRLLQQFPAPLTLSAE